jgi:hypothetical protein
MAMVLCLFLCVQRPVLVGSGKSFGLFAEDARLRVWAFRLVGHRGFEALVIVAILVRELGTQVDDHHVVNSLFALLPTAGVFEATAHTALLVEFAVGAFRYRIATVVHF